MTSGADAQAYRTQDERAPATAYYRLRMVDLDGTAAISLVVYLEQAAAGPLVYPNPAAGNFIVELPELPAAGPATLELTDASGRTVHRQVLGAIRTEVVAALPPGVYLLRVVAGGERTVTRLVVN